MTYRHNDLYEFGCFRLDPAEHLLLRDGKPVPLDPIVFGTLLLLVRHAGRVVGKEELMQTVGAGSVVEESDLTRNISAVRKALGGDEGGPQYVETVPTRGYRFVAQVRFVDLHPPAITLWPIPVVGKPASRSGTKAKGIGRGRAATLALVLIAAIRRCVRHVRKP